MSAVRYDHPVVVGYLDQSSDEALLWAADEAARHEAPLRVVHAYTQQTAYPWGYGYLIPPTGIMDAEELARGNATSLLEDVAQRLRDRSPGPRVITTLAHTNAASALVAASSQASLVVVGAHPRRGVARLASVSLALAAHAQCPVVVVPQVPQTGAQATVRLEDEFERPAATAGQVVVGVDDSPECDDAIGFAFEQASARGCGLVAVHAWWLDPAVLQSDVTDGWQEVVEEERILTSTVLVPWRGRFPEVKVTRLVGHAAVANALCAAGDGAELLVVGSRGRGGFTSLLLGSASRAVLQHAPCPVAVVRRDQLTHLHDLDRSGSGETLVPVE
jgi:nucleotide-binding universal stress UspA family protein